MSTFLDGVNQVLRIEGILRGDDDNITAFSSSQHAANIEVAKISIQVELAWLTELAEIPYEQTTGTVTVSTDTRTYSLASDFERFTAEPRLWEVDSNSKVLQTFIVVKPQEEVRLQDARYESTPGTPLWFYYIGATTTQIGMYPVPESSKNGTIYKYWYDKTTGVTTATDTMPLIKTNQFNQFCEVAARRFKYTRLRPQERDALFPGGVERDPTLEAKRATLLSLMRMNKTSNAYGRRYG